MECIIDEMELECVFFSFSQVVEPGSFVDKQAWCGDFTYSGWLPPPPYNLFYTQS